MIYLRTLIVAAALLAQSSCSIAADKINVFAAASLKTALDQVNAQWKAETGKQAIITYAASNALAKQIEAGAPADVFFSADLAWMAYLQDKGLVAKGSDVPLLGNQIVLVAAKDSKVDIRIEKDFKLAEAIGTSKLAMGNVDSVPAGKYGKAALESLGVWPLVEGKVAQAENVRAALKLVDTGEASLGIVYASDAKADPAVKVIGAFPDNSHSPIIYPAAVLSDSKNEDAQTFVTYLRSTKAKAIFEAQGFSTLIRQD
ncbi:MAG: molybdate ABC transporter substrate-binding protein [Alphaproteobacteria bacterium]|nr:molybdate ABC transporter substrate-binding protein [Alphaproteobacteria bacterium]